MADHLTPEQVAEALADADEAEKLFSNPGNITTKLWKHVRALVAELAAVDGVIAEVFPKAQRMGLNTTQSPGPITAAALARNKAISGRDIFR